MMREKIKIPNFYFWIFLFLIFSPFFVSAHPGGVDANGCHVCRTNCEKYGVPYNVLHCHVKNASSTPAFISPTPSPIPTPTPVSVPIKKATPKATPSLAPTRVLDESSTDQNGETTQPFFTKKSMLWLSSAAGLGLLAGLGFLAVREIG